MYDAIVIGGGPAGSATVYHLARAGFAVLLLDRAEFPRDKPCGEFFSPPVRGLLSDLGIYSEALSAGLHPIPTATLRCQSLPAVTGDFVSQRHAYSSCGGFSLERLVLDNLLWENAVRAGADARTGVALRGLLRDSSRRITGVSTDAGEFRASVVIGADGAHSRVARELGVVRPIPRLQKIAIVMHYAGIREETSSVEMRVGLMPPTPNQNGALPPTPNPSPRRRGEGRTIRERSQYTVQFPTPLPPPAGGGVGGGGQPSAVCGYGSGSRGTANVTLVVPESEGRAIAARGKEGYADDLLSDTFPDVAERLRGATRMRLLTCGTFGHRTTTPVADGALLVGDAAEFIDPFTGEGVYFALRGAELAAETLITALKRGDTSARGLVSYARARGQEFSPKYAVCGLIERAVHTPSLMRVAVPRLNRRPDLMNRLLGVTGDMTPPTALLSPAFLWDLICG